MPTVKGGIDLDAVKDGGIPLQAAALFRKTTGNFFGIDHAAVAMMGKSLSSILDLQVCKELAPRKFPICLSFTFSRHGTSRTSNDFNLMAGL